MRVMLDTCVIIDVLQHREPFWEDSYAAFLAIANRRADGFLSAKALTDIYYLTHHSTHDDKETRRIISTLLIPLDLVDTAGIDCRRALSSDMTDFEDAVMAESAARVGIDYIITRNQRDFEKSAVPVCSPTDFLQLVNTADD